MFFAKDQDARRQWSRTFTFLEEDNFYRRVAYPAKFYQLKVMVNIPLIKVW